MSQYPRMLFKANGSEPMHGGMFDTFIVEDEESMQFAFADGWCLTTCEATARSQLPVTADSVPSDDAPPTREELKRKATELGIAFDGRTSEAKLAALIAAKV